MTETFLEIERKFLVRSRDWPPPVCRMTMRQAYLTRQPGVAVRIRQTDDDWRLTIKVGVSSGINQEYELPVEPGMGAAMMRDACQLAPIEKTRLIVEDGGQRWEIDLFAGANDGLVIAEAELAALDQALVLPAWLGPEVTGDPRFANHALYRHPFSHWGLDYQTLVASLDSAGAHAI